MPTLAADDALTDCLRSLEQQTFENFEVIVVDNSGEKRVQSAGRVRVIANESNVGFGTAINQAIHQSTGPYVATLNDDAVADPNWLKKMFQAIEARPEVGMCASEVWMADTGTLDSAGMLIAIDGSSKQRGHGESPAKFADQRDAFFPSGSAALYRRKMLDEIGLFDEKFFLYCEDTDLGLRARWAGWKCAYVPGAIVEHRYSHSAGRASPLKAYFVERNRFYTAIKNFPWPNVAYVHGLGNIRYLWHLLFMLEGRGKASEYREAGHSIGMLLFLTFRAHLAALFRLPRLWRERREIIRSRKITRAEFRALLDEYSISLRKVAEL